MKWIGIIGTRRRDEWKDGKLIEQAVSKIYEEGDMFVSGGCRKGGDRFAEWIARNYGAPILIYHANWNKHGRIAGFVRNKLIADRADVMIACVAEDRTGGTENTLKQFNKKVILV